MEIIFIAALLLGGWFWWDSNGVREIAVRTARRACEKSGMQLLDATVTLRKIRLQRDEQGRMKLARLYAFEFSGDGTDRNHGYVVTLANRVYQLNLDLPEYVTPPGGPTLH